MEIVDEFLAEILSVEKGILALYLIGSLGGGYYRPGQSDIDTVIIVRDDAAISQGQMNTIADHYQQKYNIPKGFGSVMIRESEFVPPYLKSEIEEFEFTLEIARLKTQGKAVYGSIELDTIAMPTREDFIKDALIMERWLSREFGYPMFNQLDLASCINCILSSLSRYLILEKNLFEFNKLKIIDTYLQNNPPKINERAFEFIRNKLTFELDGSPEDLQMLQSCGIEFRDYFNKTLLKFDSQVV